MYEQMNENEKYVLEYLKKQYKERNQFYNHAGIRIIKAYNGHAVQHMDAQLSTHTNLYGNLHGGAIMTIGDSCMGVACASLGKKVVTLDSQTNFFSNLYLPAQIICEANVVHNGSRTIIMGAEICDEKGVVLARMRSTYFVIGNFEEIKAKLD